MPLVLNTCCGYPVHTGAKVVSILSLLICIIVMLITLIAAVYGEYIPIRERDDNHSKIMFIYIQSTMHFVTSVYLTISIRKNCFAASFVWLCEMALIIFQILITELNYAIETGVSNVLLLGFMILDWMLCYSWCVIYSHYVGRFIYYRSCNTNRILQPVYAIREETQNEQLINRNCFQHTGTVCINCCLLDSCVFGSLEKGSKIVSAFFMVGVGLPFFPVFASAVFGIKFSEHGEAVLMVFCCTEVFAYVIVVGFLMIGIFEQVGIFVSIWLWFTKVLVIKLIIGEIILCMYIWTQEKLLVLNFVSILFFILDSIICYFWLIVYSYYVRTFKTSSAVNPTQIFPALPVPPSAPGREELYASLQINQETV